MAKRNKKTVLPRGSYQGSRKSKSKSKTSVHSTNSGSGLKRAQSTNQRNQRLKPRIPRAQGQRQGQEPKQNSIASLGRQQKKPINKTMEIEEVEEIDDEETKAQDRARREEQEAREKAVMSGEVHRRSHDSTNYSHPQRHSLVSGQDKEEAETTSHKSSGSDVSNDVVEGANDVTVVRQGGPNDLVTLYIKMNPDSLEDETEAKGWILLRAIGVFFKTLLSRIVEACKRFVKERRLSVVYVITFIVSLAMLTHLLYYFLAQGTPVTSNSSQAFIRIFIAVIGAILVSTGSFFVLNLNIHNMGIGLILMFLIVSLMYFVIDAMSKSGFSLDRQTDLNKTIAEVYQFTNHTFYVNIPHKLPDFFKHFTTHHKCCDFHCYLCNRTGSVHPEDTMWSLIWPLEKTQPKGDQMLPKFCCDIGDSQGTCNETERNSRGVGRYCDNRHLLKVIEQMTAFSAAYAAILFILTVAMAFVFWIIYSGIKSREFGNESQPPDYDLLNLHAPGLADQKYRINQMKAEMRRRRHLATQQLKQKHGLPGKNLLPATVGIKWKNMAKGQANNNNSNKIPTPTSSGVSVRAKPVSNKGSRSKLKRFKAAATTAGSVGSKRIINPNKVTPSQTPASTPSSTKVVAPAAPAKPQKQSAWAGLKNSFKKQGK